MKKILSILALLALSFIFLWSDANAALDRAWTVHNDPQMFLNKSINTTTTDIELAAPQRNGETVTFPTTGGGTLRLKNGSRVEDISFTGAVIQSDSEVTLMGVVRDICWNQADTLITCSNGLSFPRGSIVELNVDARQLNWKVDENKVTPMTLSGALRSDQTSQPFLFLNGHTTTQISNFSYNGASGDHGITYDETEGCFKGFDGSSWMCFANSTGALVNATELIRGVVSLASTGAALTASGQGIGGSFNVLQSLYTTPVGGAQAGYVPVVSGQSGLLSGSLLGTGTKDSTTFLRGDQTWAAPVTDILTMNVTNDFAQSGSIFIRAPLNEFSLTRTDIKSGLILTDNATVLSAVGDNIEWCNSPNVAADFEASASEYLSAIDNATTSVSGTTSSGNLTIALWVKVESAPSGGSYGLAGKWGGSANEYNFSYVENAGLKLNLDIVAGTSTNVAVDLGTATWKHVAVVYTASAGSAAFYVNGAQVGATQTGMTAGITDSTGLVNIGATNGGSNFDGQIQDVVMWKAALTSAEILSVYNLYTSNCML